MRLCLHRKAQSYTPCSYHGKICCLDCVEFQQDCDGCRILMDTMIGECKRADEEQWPLNSISV